MSNCPGCGGVVGRDCWNPQECEWITRDVMTRYEAGELRPPEQQPEPCQGCHYITGLMIQCLGICAGMQSQDDADARAAVWASLPGVHA